jgi:16S rRNA (cytidine1402-2'-O)-methyltransferase
LKNWLLADPNQQKGEFVVLVAGAEEIADNDTLQETQKILEILLNELPTSQAIQLATKITGEKKNKLYEMALKYKR